MKRTPIFVVAAIAVAAVAIAGINDSVTLKRVAKKGDVSEYKLEMELDLQGTELEISADLTEEVLKIEKDGGFTVEETMENMVIMMGGSDMSGGEDHQTSETTYAPSGLIKSMKSDDGDPDGYRFASMMNFMWPTKPVDVDSEWTIKTKADTEKGTYDMSFSYSILAREKVQGHDCFKIKFAHKELSGGEASSSGTVWIVVNNGVVVKIDGMMIAVPMQGMSMDASYRLELQN